MLAEEQIWAALGEVKDPEIPVVSLVEMGIVRGVALEGQTVVVTITPTFSGCPALHAMQGDIVTRLKEAGAADVRVEVTLAPAWTTDWISEEAREKLRSFGLAPPPVHGGDFEITLMEAVACPYCESENTSLRNPWGPTPCRTIYYCNSCRQAFEQFKPL
jgi:ring-1,2-phenylacetyl-CoA epoxidase subunit PaaD